MPLTLARRERHDLCDLAVLLGSDAPTLCDGWTAHQLLAHLFVREHRPLGAVGLLAPGLGGLTDRSMARAERIEHGVLAAKMREPGLTPYALKPVEVLANTLENLVHHEDLRRGQPDWQQRDLAPADLDTIWSSVSRMGGLMVRPAGVPVAIRRSDTGATKVLRKGDSPVTIGGPVVDVTLYLFGRSEVRDLTFEGPDDAVAKLKAADLGM